MAVPVHNNLISLRQSTRHNECFSLSLTHILFCVFFLLKDTSVVPPLIYAVMGTSREIAIGPVAVVSLLLSSMIQNIVDPAADPATYRSLVFTVTFLAGVFQVSFGLFRSACLLLLPKRPYAVHVQVYSAALSSHA